MSNCERAEKIIVEAMEEAKKLFTTAINGAEKNESRLDFMGNYSATLSVLAEALGKISTERN